MCSDARTAVSQILAGTVKRTRVAPRRRAFRFRQGKVTTLLPLFVPPIVVARETIVALLRAISPNSTANTQRVRTHVRGNREDRQKRVGVRDGGLAGHIVKPITAQSRTANAAAAVGDDAAAVAAAARFAADA